MILLLPRFSSQAGQGGNAQTYYIDGDIYCCQSPLIQYSNTPSAAAEGITRLCYYYGPALIIIISNCNTALHVCLTSVSMDFRFRWASGESCDFKPPAILS